MEKAVIGIDIGGSTTKIVGFHFYKDKKPALIEPLFVRATDPVTSLYGAFGKFTLENGIDLDQIDRVMTTGVGSSFTEKPIYGLHCTRVPEFTCNGLGGLFLSGLGEAIVVSMGTGTALIYAKANHFTADGDPILTGEADTTIEYLGGTGVGGGTLLGLSRLLTGINSIEHIEQLCDEGNLANIDLRVGDISHDRFLLMNPDLTASNFGRVNDMATQNDLALGIVNLVAETICTTAIFAARAFHLKNIVLIGNLTAIKPVRRVFESLEKQFDVHFLIPGHAQFGTVIGAALYGSNH